MAAKQMDSVLLQSGRIAQRWRSGCVPQRAFGNSAPRHRAGQIPQFIESEASPELNTLLADVRSKVFVPGYLKVAQRKLVFRTRHHPMLLNEPFFVDVGDESVQLQPLDLTKDVPATWKSCREAMRLMGDSPSAWQNLIPLLEGVKVSRKGRDLLAWQQTCIVKKAALSGMAHIVLEAVRAADRTGVRMRHVHVAREVIWACRSLAELGDWDDTSTEKAVRYALQISNLLDEVTHCGGKTSGTKELFETHGDPRRQPDIIGAVLELAAVRAERHANGADEHRLVAQMTERLLSNIDLATEGEGSKKNAGVSGSDTKDAAKAADADYQLERWVPVLGGLLTAKKVLGEALPQPERVDAKIQELREQTRQWRSSLATLSPDSQERRRGARWFDGLDA